MHVRVAALYTMKVLWGRGGGGGCTLLILSTASMLDGEVGGGGGLLQLRSMKVFFGGGVKGEHCCSFQCCGWMRRGRDGGGSPGAGMGVGPLPPPPAPHPVDFLTLYRKATLHASQGVAESSSSLFLQPSS